MSSFKRSVGLGKRVLGVIANCLYKNNGIHRCGLICHLPKCFIVQSKNRWVWSLGWSMVRCWITECINYQIWTNFYLYYTFKVFISSVVNIMFDLGTFDLQKNLIPISQSSTVRASLCTSYQFFIILLSFFLM